MKWATEKASTFQIERLSHTFAETVTYFHQSLSLSPFRKSFGPKQDIAILHKKGLEDSHWGTKNSIKFISQIHYHKPKALQFYDLCRLVIGSDGCGFLESLLPIPAPPEQADRCIAFRHIISGPLPPRYWLFAGSISRGIGAGRRTVDHGLGTEETVSPRGTSGKSAPAAAGYCIIRGYSYHSKVYATSP